MNLKGLNTLKKEDLLKLGLTEEQATQVANTIAEEMKGFIPKARFDEVNTLKNEYEAKINDPSKVNVEEIKQQLETVKTEMTQKEADYQAKIKDLTLDSAVKLALSGKVHDADIVAELLKKGGLELDDKGNIQGLDDKVKTLKESKPFLFVQEQPNPQPNPNPFQFQGKIGNPKQDNPSPTGPTDLNSAIAETLFGAIPQK